jgi:hypothetical protein
MSEPKRTTTAEKVEQAMTNLADARTRINEAKRRQARARDAKAKAVANWAVMFPKPTQRELIAAVNKHNAERQRTREAAENAAPASHLDAVLRSGMGGTADFGYRRPRAALRGKLPSQR